MLKLKATSAHTMSPSASVTEFIPEKSLTFKPKLVQVEASRKSSQGSI